VPPDHTVVGALRRPSVLRRELVAGLVTSLALIPEVLSFAVVAGVDPRTGLYTAVVMAVVTAVVGGRPAMVTAAAGATALVIAPLVREHGTDYLVATVLLAGLLQIVLAGAGVARLLRFIPRSVMVGFVNALATLIFIAQLDHVIGVPWAVYPMAVAAIGVMVGLPRLTVLVPAPLVVIVVLTAVVMIGDLDVPDVADQGELPTGLPGLVFPDVPWSLQTLEIIAPYAVAVALVGLLESLLTAKLVDDITDTHSDKTRESAGQGIANLAAGAFGGMGGCAMIGQTMVNVKTVGGRTRISSFAAGAWLLALLLGLGDLVGAIPMVALAGVMMVVAVTTFDWRSLRHLPRMPKSESTVMITTVVVVVATHNLAIGVVVGVLVAMVLFARRVAHLANVERELVQEEDGSVVAHYTVGGELFFASSNDHYYQFDYAGDPDKVLIDLSHSHIWDASTVAALDDVGSKYARKGKQADIVGLDRVSADFHRRLTGRLGSH